MELLLACLCLILAFTAPNFLSVTNLLNVLRSVSMQGVIAFGMTMVIIAGEIDLSVGSAVVFSGCLMAYMTEYGLPVPFGLLVTLAMGFSIGTFTGLLRTLFEVPSFITTLALLTGLKGAALMVTSGFSITPFPQWYNFFGGGYVVGIPFPAILLMVTFAVVHFLMNYTSFGRLVYAVGANAEAARLSGANVNQVRIFVLAITGAFAALSGIVLSARIMSGSPTAAQGWELDVIAAVIIGGTSLSGGIGSVRGTLVGVLFIGVIINGLTLLNVPIYWQNVVRGLVILVAVLINRIQMPRR